eukprot:5026657-Lingulodinium_polyedra.AAC.1
MRFAASDHAFFQLLSTWPAAGFQQQLQWSRKDATELQMVRSFCLMCMSTFWSEIHCNRCCRMSCLA